MDFGLSGARILQLMICMRILVCALNLGTHTSVFIVSRRTLPLRLHGLLRGIRSRLLSISIQGTKTLRSFARRYPHRLLILTTLPKMSYCVHHANLSLELWLLRPLRNTIHLALKICLTHRLVLYLRNLMHALTFQVVASDLRLVLVLRCLVLYSCRYGRQALRVPDSSAAGRTVPFLLCSGVSTTRLVTHESVLSVTTSLVTENVCSTSAILDLTGLIQLLLGL